MMILWHFLGALLLLALVSAEKLSTGEDSSVYVERMIFEKDVVVFAKSYCPFCKHTRELLSQYHQKFNQEFEFEVIDLDLLPEGDGPAIQMELLKETEQKTVPNIFIEGEHIGGDSDLRELHESGDLQEMLEELTAGFSDSEPSGDSEM